MGNLASGLARPQCWETFHFPRPQDLAIGCAAVCQYASMPAVLHCINETDHVQGSQWSLSATIDAHPRSTTGCSSRSRSAIAQTPVFKCCPPTRSQLPAEHFRRNLALVGLYRAEGSSRSRCRELHNLAPRWRLSQMHQLTYLYAGPSTANLKRPPRTPHCRWIWSLTMIGIPSCMCMCSRSIWSIVQLVEKKITVPRLVRHL